MGNAVLLVARSVLAVNFVAELGAELALKASKVLADNATAVAPLEMNCGSKIPGAEAVGSNHLATLKAGS